MLNQIYFIRQLSRLRMLMC